MLVIVCVAVMAAVVLVALLKPRARRLGISCENNMKQVGLAFRSWAIDHEGQLPMQVSVTNGGTKELIASGKVFPHFQVMSNELSTPRILLCPEEKWIRKRPAITILGWGAPPRNFATKFQAGLTDNNVSYFVNVDGVTDETDPARLLSGDRNLTNKFEAGSRFVPVSKATPLGWTEELHKRQGNVLFSDGSVHGMQSGATYSTASLPDGVTNRLAIP
jgi:prepilin-type processing-associated H-X9-DG protein